MGPAAAVGDQGRGEKPRHGQQALGPSRRNQEQISVEEQMEMREINPWSWQESFGFAHGLTRATTDRNSGARRIVNHDKEGETK